MANFHSNLAHTESPNRAHIILLPKSNDTATLDAYHPISLQSCPIKAVTKILTNRLKPLVPLLVLGNQTGFISGQNITIFFVYAADLVSSCHTRKKPTMIIKLDFKKAFNSLSWESLISVL